MTDPAYAPSHRYPDEALQVALERISSQGLWLLLSLDRYGWRAELDVVSALVLGDTNEHRAEQHRPLVAVGHMFAIVDKLWRLTYAIRAHRAGREFLNKKDGYLASGYKLHRKIEQLAAITEDEWRSILDVPSDAAIRGQLAASGASEMEIATRLSFASELPQLIALNMRELGQLFDSEKTETGPRERTYSLRELDGQYRHGAPVVYMDCSPTALEWRGVTAGDGLPEDMLVGVVMLPPDEAGASFISRVEFGDSMKTVLLAMSMTLAGLVHRLVRAYLVQLAPGLAEPLAAVADYEVDTGS